MKQHRTVGKLLLLCEILWDMFCARMFAVPLWNVLEVVEDRWRAEPTSSSKMRKAELEERQDATVSHCLLYL